MLVNPQDVAGQTLGEIPQPQQQDPTAGGGGTVDPASAHYLGPESGPFACQNCGHFAAPSVCDALSAPVDPGGMCNLFASGAGQADGEQLPALEALAGAVAGKPDAGGQKAAF